MKKWEDIYNENRQNINTTNGRLLTNMKNLNIKEIGKEQKWEIHTEKEIEIFNKYQKT